MKWFITSHVIQIRAQSSLAFARHARAHDVPADHALNERHDSRQLLARHLTVLQLHDVADAVEQTYGVSFLALLCKYLCKMLCIEVDLIHPETTSRCRYDILRPRYGLVLFGMSGEPRELFKHSIVHLLLCLNLLSSHTTILCTCFLELLAHGGVLRCQLSRVGELSLRICIFAHVKKSFPLPELSFGACGIQYQRQGAHTYRVAWLWGLLRRVALQVAERQIGEHGDLQRAQLVAVGAQLSSLELCSRCGLRPWRRRFFFAPQELQATLVAVCSHWYVVLLNPGVAVFSELPHLSQEAVLSGCLTCPFQLFTDRRVFWLQLGGSHELNLCLSGTPEFH
mmetsp:Transcript_43042/g.80133  ORF Transcript_43042/g.80133 Transcript_43042/m.80133 type:complete len:339 (-) Transcript_43042:593-1609(-)